MGSEAHPLACYILSDESGIPYYSTSNGCKYFVGHYFGSSLIALNGALTAQAATSSVSAPLLGHRCWQHRCTRKMVILFRGQ